MTGHCFLTKDETISISVVEEIVSDIGEFKTDGICPFYKFLKQLYDVK